MAEGANKTLGDAFPGLLAEKHPLSEPGFSKSHGAGCGIGAMLQMLESPKTSMVLGMICKCEWLGLVQERGGLLVLSLD